MLVPDGGFHLNLYVTLAGSRTTLRDFSGLHIATSAPRLFFGNRRPVSSMMSDHCRTYENSAQRTIGVVPGRRMGLFRVKIMLQKINCPLSRWNSLFNSVYYKVKIDVIQVTFSLVFYKFYIEKTNLKIYVFVAH